MNNLTVQRMWKIFLKKFNETPESTNKTVYSWHFETREEPCNQLLKLVKEGKKTGTSCTKDSFDASDEVIPKIGDYHVITNWNGDAHCIIRTTAINIIPYKDVGPDFAKKEGEGDLSLEYWRSVHYDIYKEEQGSCGKHFDAHTLIVCEEFELVYSVDKDD